MPGFASLELRIFLSLKALVLLGFLRERERERALLF
jgi:hypothetical protein